MKFTSFGAAEVVTGSCHRLETEDVSFIVDCGMFQGGKELNRINYEDFGFDPSDLDFMILTHGHIDHCGLIPKLVKNGFKGLIYCSPATADLLPIMLADAAHIQEMDTEHENMRRKRAGQEEREPLYDTEDAEAVTPLIRAIDYGTKFQPHGNIELVFRDAGHVIGSSIVEVFVTESGKQSKVVFSGDLGQSNVPIIENPSVIEQADYVFIESTYGTTVREKRIDRKEEIYSVIKSTLNRGGKVIIPCFALERTQEIIYTIGDLQNEYPDFPKVPVYIDSPLAIKITEVFKNHTETYDKEAREREDSPFSFPNLKTAMQKEDSQEITKSKNPCIVLAGSGMCTAGRIRHHIRHGIENPANTILFVGYQSPGTLGRILLEGAKDIKMMGRRFVVKAEIKRISSFSAHADQRELTEWLQAFQPKPKKVFLVHGEPDVLEEFSSHLHDKGFKTVVVQRNEVYEQGM